jgi:hypothetical protein
MTAVVKETVPTSNKFLPDFTPPGLAGRGFLCAMRYPEEKLAIMPGGA